jgi:hypothetical protein
VSTPRPCKSIRELRWLAEVDRHRGTIEFKASQKHRDLPV